MLPALLAALLAAVCYGAATVLQAVGVRRLADTPASAGWLARGWAGRLYAAGLALDALGFVAAVVALRTLPLFVVQSAIASSVAVTALLAVWFLGARLSRRELAALGVTGLGLVALAASATEGPAARLSGPAAWLVLALAVPVAAMAVGAVRMPRTDPRSAVLLAVAAGLGFGGVGVAARVIASPHPWWHLAGDPLAWAVVAYGALALGCYGLALERGAVTTTAAVTFGVETLVPAAAGLLWLGDTVRSGFAVVAAVGFVATLGGCVALARYAEVGAPEPAGRQLG